jgi:ABC-type sulfate transport system permease component
VCPAESEAEDATGSAALTLVSCTITPLLALVVAIPLGYLLSRHRFRGRQLIDAILDIPIVLPPLRLGIGLLILFQLWPFRLVANRVVFQVPAVILAQFMVSAAFAARIIRVAFDQIDRRLTSGLASGAERDRPAAASRSPGTERGRTFPPTSAALPRHSNTC